MSCVSISSRPAEPIADPIWNECCLGASTTVRQGCIETAVVLAQVAAAAASILAAKAVVVMGQCSSIKVGPLVEVDCLLAGLGVVVLLVQALHPPSLHQMACPEPGGSACCFWNGCEPVYNPAVAVSRLWFGELQTPSGNKQVFFIYKKGSFMPSTALP